MYIKEREFLKKIFQKLDLPKRICDHLLSEDHKPIHRHTLGLVIILVGITIQLIPSHYLVGTILLHTGGTVCDGIGLVPIMNSLFKKII